MSAFEDAYLEQVLDKYKVSSVAESYANAIKPELRRWAGPYLEDIYFSGSYAKGTAVMGTTDIDLFISLDDRADTIQGVYKSLYDFAVERVWNPRPQNVSIGITQHNIQIDLVPGRRQPGYQNLHWLYHRRTGYWIQTDVKAHIDAVRNSGRTREIKAIKIWRECQRLHFPSFYLELIVMKALSGKPWNALASNVADVFSFMANSFETTRVIDPANSNNVVSDDLSLVEKRSLSLAAQHALNGRMWHELLW